MNSAYAAPATPYHSIDRESARALCQAIAYQPPAADYAELQRQREARNAEKAARHAAKARQKELNAFNSGRKAAADSASVFSFRSFGSSIGLLSRKSHDKKRR